MIMAIKIMIIMIINLNYNNIDDNNSHYNGNRNSNTNGKDSNDSTSPQRPQRPHNTGDNRSVLSAHNRRPILRPKLCECRGNFLEGFGNLARVFRPGGFPFKGFKVGSVLPLNGF